MTQNLSDKTWWKPHRELALAAQTQVPVMVTAHSGEQRRAFAKFIHDASARHDRPFVAVSCSVNPPDGDLHSWFSEAAGGTLFVDDLGNMSAALQDQFCSALCHPLETTHDLHEVRVITGALPAWPTAMERTRFSESLYYRLNVMRVDCVRPLEDGFPEHVVGRATSVGPFTRLRRSGSSRSPSRATRGR